MIINFKKFGKKINFIKKNANIRDVKMLKTIPLSIEIEQ